MYILPHQSSIEQLCFIAHTFCVLLCTVNSGTNHGNDDDIPANDDADAAKKAYDGLADEQKRIFRPAHTGTSDLHSYLRRCF